MKRIIILGMLLASSSAFALQSQVGSVTFATSNSGMQVDINGSGHAGGSITNTSTASVLPGHHGGQVNVATSTTEGSVASHRGFAPGSTASVIAGASGVSGAAGTTGNATGLWSNTFVNNYFQPAPQQ